MSTEAARAHGSALQRLDLGLIILDERSKTAVNRDAGRAQGECTCTGCGAAEERLLVPATMLELAPYVPCVLVLPSQDAAEACGELDFCDAMLHEPLPVDNTRQPPPEEPLLQPPASQPLQTRGGHSAIEWPGTTWALVRLIARQLRLLRFVQPSLFPSFFLDEEEEARMLNRGAEQLLRGARAFALVILASCQQSGQPPYSSPRRQPPSNKASGRSPRLQAIAAEWDAPSRRCAACEARDKEAAGQLQRAAERLGCAEKLSDVLMKHVLSNDHTRDVHFVGSKWCKSLGACVRMWPSYYLSERTLRRITVSLEQEGETSAGARLSSLSALVTIFSGADGRPAFVKQDSLRLLQQLVARHSSALLRLCVDPERKVALRALDLLVRLVRAGFVREADCVDVCRAVLGRLPAAHLMSTEFGAKVLHLIHAVFFSRALSTCLDDSRGGSHDRPALAPLRSRAADDRQEHVHASGSSPLGLPTTWACAGKLNWQRKLRRLKAVALIHGALEGAGAMAAAQPVAARNAAAASTSSGVRALLPGPSSVGSAGWVEVIEAMLARRDHTGSLLRDWPFVLACLIGKELVDKIELAHVLACGNSRAGVRQNVGTQSRAHGGWVEGARDIAILSILHNGIEALKQDAALGGKHAGPGAGGTERDSGEGPGLASEAAAKGCAQNEGSRRGIAALKLLTFLSGTSESSSPSLKEAPQDLTEVCRVLSALVPCLPEMPARAEAGTGAIAPLQRICAELKAHVLECARLRQRLACFRADRVGEPM